MAREQHLGASEEWFIGEDKTLEFEIYSSDEATIEDTTGWAIMWVLRKQGESDAIVITKTTGAATIEVDDGDDGFDPDPDVNTQRVVVTIDDTDTDNLQPGVYQHALKRTDSGSETILSYGTAVLKKAAL